MKNLEKEKLLKKRRTAILISNSAFFLLEGTVLVVFIMAVAYIAGVTKYNDLHWSVWVGGLFIIAVIVSEKVKKKLDNKLREVFRELY